MFFYGKLEIVKLLVKQENDAIEVNEKDDMAGPLLHLKIMDGGCGPTWNYITLFNEVFRKLRSRIAQEAFLI